MHSAKMQIMTFSHLYECREEKVNKKHLAENPEIDD
jgi:hypothetical protein